MKDLIQAFIAKFYQAVIIVLTAFLLLTLLGLGVQTWRASSWQNDYKNLDAKYQTDIAKAEALTEKAKADAKAIELKWSEKLLIAEKNYSEKLTEIIIDSNHAKSIVDSMSKQIDTATSRMSTATKETIIEYANTNGDILKECINRYQWVAEQADKHAVDAKRLSDAWPE